jgi:DDE superfamily endonuclease
MFKLPTDPKFAEKLKDVVGLYVDAPARRSLGRREKPDSGARPHPAGAADEAGARGYDDARLQASRYHHAISLPSTSSMAPSSAATCSAIGIRSSSAYTIEAQVPAGKMIHAVVDNYATHKHPKVRQWLAGHPRWAFHFTPTSASWLNAVEGFFAKLTRQRLKRGVFQSVVDLQLTINRFVADTNADPKPFVWTADPKRVLAAIKRGKQTLESIH